ncbi:hypothetical protein ADK74_02295 [Streptomyces decoyicus]|uniref:DUF6777 domain-containing protein n=1 Tax=Streptomyces decoyicus TaxID=249567 RepID=UPI0006C2F582|nr:DUF6777 domain-containing protein [Streptomyces decoyicus]KOG50267.1 hypothetical protein ADK74_02295 [Streptomyces decoyicus]QZY18794.1 hypothetical protein K7C20_29045 [Streptomyces decoyicus]
MTSPPPPDSHPTGPPSGPLSGPSSEPSHEPTQVGPAPGRTPPEEPTEPGSRIPPGGPGEGDGGGGGGGGSGRGGGGGAGGAAGGGKPWWRSAPRVAIIAAAVVAAVIVTMLLTRPGGSGTSEVFAEPAASTGQDPVTKSTANDSSPTSSGKPRKPSGGGNSTFEGATPGLYGGTQNSASCDVEKQITYLTGSPERNQAFAGVLGEKPGQVPSYLRSLTPLQLGYDTRVTNHGFKDGKATSFQSVLQAGTAVMVDSYGVPRVRCKCGNPLTEPTPLQGNVKTVGTKWPGYEPSNAVVVKPAKTKVKEFVLRDPKTGKWFKRPEGSTGTTDTPTAPPDKTPSGPTTSEPPNGSPSAGETSTGTSGPPTSDTGTASPESPADTGGSDTTGGPSEQPPTTSEGTTGGDTTGGTPDGGTPGSSGSHGGGVTQSGGGGTPPSS